MWLCTALQRPRAVKLKYQDATGAVQEMELSGWPARIFQHEFDHLQVRPLHHCAVWHCVGAWAWAPLCGSLGLGLGLTVQLCGS